MAAVCCSQRTSALISLKEAAARSIRLRTVSKDSGVVAAAPSAEVNTNKMAARRRIKTLFSRRKPISMGVRKRRSGPGDCHVALDLSLGVQDRFHTGNHRYFARPAFQQFRHFCEALIF